MNRLRIAVLGYLVRGPIGGMAWHHLQYVLGLAKLGHDVRFIEDSDDYPSCYDPTRGVVDEDPAYGLRFAEATFHRLGLSECWAYYDAHAGVWYGPTSASILEWLTRADLLLNVSGVNPLRPWVLGVSARALIDTDPAFTQIRHLTDSNAHERAAAHTAFFTFGENIPAGRSSVPADGFAWQPTRQPVVLDAWPQSPAPSGAYFTTVMQWDSYPARVFAGKSYGMKSESFAEYLDLPQRCGELFELAVGSASAPRELLRERGWLLRDPLEVTRDPWTYQEYIRGSRAEFSVAKHGYVSARTGWFSERSACYLASGRPVLVQDTGFTDWLRAVGGVVAFRTPEEAATGVAQIESRYEFHAREARVVVAEYFDARKVLSELIEQALGATSSSASSAGSA
ncbi:MAG: hypothetical protein L0241_24315 [Planctomycetia bacterium]|nr:hypothetical protein [Planctomycetia bacterium]